MDPHSINKISAADILYGQMDEQRRPGSADWRERILMNEANCGVFPDQGLFGKMHGWVGTKEWCAYSNIVWAHDQLRFWRVADDQGLMYKRGRKPDSASEDWIKYFHRINPVDPVSPPAMLTPDERSDPIAQEAQRYQEKCSDVRFALPKDQLHTRAPLVSAEIVGGSRVYLIPGAYIRAVEDLTSTHTPFALNCIWKADVIGKLAHQQHRLVCFDTQSRPWGSVVLKHGTPTQTS